MSYTLNQLTEEVIRQVQLVVSEIKTLPLEKLQKRPTSGGWNVLECLEHLNRYCRYYLMALEKAMVQNPATTTSKQEITLTWFGKKSVKMVSAGNPKKHKTVKKMDPQGASLPETVVTEFLAHQKQLLALIQKASGTDLSKKNIPVEFFRLLKLNTGETLLFITLHQERHFAQLKRILDEVTNGNQAAA